MKRFGIFAFEDVNGRIDGYVDYLLSELRNNIQYLIIICKKKDYFENINIIKAFADEVIFCNDDISRTVMYAAALKKKEIIRKIQNYDELILMNDLVFGPFIPLSEILKKIEILELDFSGLFYQNEWYLNNEVKENDYIPGYFWVVQKRVLRENNLLWQFFKRSIKERTIHEYEHQFLEQIRNKGFKVGTLINSHWNFEDAHRNFDILNHKCFEMISQNKLPFLPKECFTTFIPMNFSMKPVMKYIEEYTDYKTELIWENILRVCNGTDLKNAFCLNYILPWKTRIGCGGKNYEDVLVVAHLYYEDCIQECWNYLTNVPPSINIVITSSNEKICKQIERNIETNHLTHITVRQVINRGRDAAALFVGCGDILENYKYLCYVHDKKTSGNKGWEVIGDKYRYLVWENCLKSRNYIENVIDLFGREEKLGFLSPPFPLFSDYLDLIGNEWTLCFEATEKFAKHLKLQVNISAEKVPFTFSNSFWCKIEVLKPIINCNLQYEDFPTEPLAIDGTINHAIERIYAYCALNQGCLAGILETTEYAENSLINMMQAIGAKNITNGRLRWSWKQVEEDKQRLISESVCLQGENQKLMEDKQRLISESVCLQGENQKLMEDRSELAQKISLNSKTNLLLFCKRHKKLYIYGAGKKARRITEELWNQKFEIESYLISDGQSGKEATNKVKHISDVLPLKLEYGVIVALNDDNLKNAKPLIEKFINAEHIFYAY